jgi:hypothetical protein
LTAECEYDLDNVSTLAIAKTTMTQKELKHLYGDEVKDYARAHGMVVPLEEKNRCWRLHYSDEATFHLDTLPCVFEERDVVLAITSRGVPHNWQSLLSRSRTDGIPNTSELLGTF